GRGAGDGGRLPVAGGCGGADRGGEGECGIAVMEVKRLAKKEFDAIYSLVPRLTVEVVVQTDAGIVLTRRAIEPAKGKWHIPGGTVFKGETLRQAVKRVARE